MKQTQKTRVVSGRRRGGSVLARERKGSDSHSGEWRRALWRERESDVSHLHLGRSGRIFFLGVVEQLYRMRDRGIPAASRKLNRMRDCVVLMKKVVTVLLPLASVLLLVAARKDL